MLYKSEVRCRCGCYVDIFYREDKENNFHGYCLVCDRYTHIEKNDVTILDCDEIVEEFILTIRGNINEMV